MSRYRFVCIGTGPGPKNVLAEDEYGHRVVFTYRNWLKEKTLADKEYGSVEGFIQFEVEERELEGDRVVRDATVRSIATGDLVRITLWPDFEDVDVEKGDWLAADGQFTSREHKGKTYVNMSPFTVVALKSVKSSPPEAKEKPAPKKKTF
jgi:hypothetical protein